MKIIILLILSTFVLVDQDERPSDVEIVSLVGKTKNPKEKLELLSQVRNIEGLPDTLLNRYYLGKGIAHGRLGIIDSSVFYLDLCKESSQKSGDENSLMRAYNTIGTLMRFQGEQQKSLKAFQKADSICADYGDRYTRSRSVILGNIGGIFFDLEEYTLARVYAEKAIEIAKKNNSTSELAFGYLRLAIVTEAQDSLEASLKYNKLAAKSLSILGDTTRLIFVEHNLGNIFKGLGDLQESLIHHKQAGEYAKNLGDIETESKMMTSIGEIYLELGQLQRARKFARDALYIAEKGGFPVPSKNAHQLLYEIASQSGNYEIALGEYVLSAAISDSLNSAESRQKLAEIEVKYETAANKQKIIELELDQKNATLSIVESKNQRDIFISGFVILLIVVWFLFYQYRTKKRTSDILSTKNEQISEALAEREILLKEIHHRVKNNLQVISSLLYLQAESLDDETAIDAVRQGQHRVEAMGLIHQRLYSADDVRGVDIQGYFEQLCEEIITVFGDEDTEIDYQVETNKLKLDIDTVIPLGLIVNELITNAIKYAFREKEEGLIAINVNQEENKLVVRVKDNGIGMTEESLKKANSFGWKMMRSLSRKLEAEIKIKNDSGTIVELIAARYKLVK